MEGLVFNIQKFSLHDGPGIRTTVFFKGCPLTCKWCSNPESQSSKIQILYDHSKCIHCLLCIHACNHHAINYIDDTIMINESKCIGCMNCVNQCKVKALSYEGKYYDVDEIVSTCMQDIDFYEESNGGVTISGGEGMCQPEFLVTLVQKLKEKKLHVAIETTGFIDSDIFQKLAAQFDLLLFDVKHYDEIRHLEGTGVSNELIISNLSWALHQGIEILPRIPIIPDFNDSLEDAKQFAQLFQTLNIKKAQLLPFHQFGEKKYELLHKEYLYKNKKALYPEDLSSYQKVFLDANIDCFF